MTRRARRFSSLVLASVMSAVVAAAADPPTAAPSSAPSSAPALERRAFRPEIDGVWIGNGISYGPHRDGQTPEGGPQPTKENVREDARILARHWKLVRMYGYGDATRFLCEVIREENLPLRLMAGAWIQPEGDPNDGEFAARKRANEEQVAGATKLANDYPDIVLAVSIGNETQVFWSSHKTQADQLIRDIRRARTLTKAPVTTADDFNFWNKPESKAVAAEVDFIVTHIYAMWAGQQLDRALLFTKEKWDEVRKMHPDQLFVIGEAGWATQKRNSGEQANLIKGVAGEDEQTTFCKQYLEWVTSEKITNFYFQAFDEKWKGGQQPDEVEKHWGLYNSDRTPKKAVREVLEKSRTE